MPDRIIVSAPGPQGPAGSGGGGSISDGDKGDITVSGVGTVWTVDAGAITTDKLQTIGAQKLLGRSGATTGNVEQIGLSADLEIDGSKNLALANAVAQQSITLTAGTGLTGGGTLAADRTFNVAYGTTASTACEGNDARLSDARTPTAHTHAPSDIQQGGAVTGEVLKWNGSAWAPGTDNTSGGGGGAPTSAQYFTLTADATLSDERVLTFGTGLTATDGGAGAQYDVEVDYGTTAATACEGNDSRLSDARAPTAHTHDFVDSYVGHIEAPAVGTYYIDTYAATARTVTGIHIVTGSGTVDYTLNKVASGVTGTIYTANGQGTTQANVTSGLSNTALVAGNQLQLEIDATSSGADVRFTIVYSRATGAIT